MIDIKIDNNSLLRGLRIQKGVLYVKEIFGHKMWGMAQMIVPGENRDTRPYEKSAHLLVCSSAQIIGSKSITPPPGICGYTDKFGLK